MTIQTRSPLQAEAVPAGQTLARRSRLRRMSRHPLLIVIAAILAIAGLALCVSYIQSKPVTLKMAVGPRQSEDERLVQQLAQYLARERAPVRIALVRQEGPQGSAEALEAGQADLAVVRRDVLMPKTGQVVAIHRRNVAVLAVPPAQPAKTEETEGAEPDAQKAAAPNPRETAAAASAKPVEKIEDLSGKTVAIVGRTRANIQLLHAILGQYGVPPHKVSVQQFATEDLTAQLKAAKFDALLAVGPVGSKITAEALAALTRGKEAPAFLEVGSSEAIEQQNPVYEATEIPAGAFGGSRPAEAIETIGVSHYIVARRSLDNDVAGLFTKWLFNAKQAQGGDFPAFTKIASPDTDKAATLAVHPGTLAYLEGEQTGFFERYSEAMYWGLMLLSFFGSGAAWLASYGRRSGASASDRGDLESLIGILRRARSAAAVELDLLGIEIDDIVERAIRQIEAGDLDQNRAAATTLAADQARRAIAERRALLGMA